jgi:dUTP pyrophosphatase
VKLSVQKLRPDAIVPKYMTDFAAGLDLAAALDEEILLQPGERRLVPTGLSIALPPGHEGQVRPRSGLSLKKGITCLNTPGTIDEDYRGEVKVLLVNLGQEPVAIAAGDRIAQLVVAPVARVVVEEVTSLTETSRGGGGFGSTGA